MFKGTTVTPTNVRVKAISATNISLTWDDVRLTCCDIVGYRVEWTAVSDGKVQYQELAGAPSQANLTGLTPFTNYSFAVAAVNKEGQVVGTFSQPLAVETDEDSKFEYDNMCTRCPLLRLTYLGR